MKESISKKTGKFILFYAIFCAGLLNFALWLSIAITIGFAGTTVGREYLFNFLSITLLTAFISSLIGGIALVANKAWGRKIALFSVFVSIIHVCSVILFTLPTFFTRPILNFLGPLFLLLKLLYLFFLIFLWRKIKSSKAISFKNWKIVTSVFVVCIILIVFYISFFHPIFFGLKESPINGSSSLSLYDDHLFFAMEDDVYVVSAGKRLKQLTNTPNKIESNPISSADGSLICFVRHLRPRTHRQIEAGLAYSFVVAKTDGSDQQVVFRSKKGSLISNPVFSPNGKKILFILNESMCEVNIDSTDFKRLNISYLMSPRYSKDGKSIYGLREEYLDQESLRLGFKERMQAAEDLKINVIKINLDSLKQQIVGQIPKRPRIYDLTLSPNAEKILFIKVPKNNKHKSEIYTYQIYIGDVSNSQITQLTSGAGPKQNLAFTPNGSKIIFVHQEPEYSGKRSIKIMDIDGDNTKTLFTR